MYMLYVNVIKCSQNNVIMCVKYTKPNELCEFLSSFTWDEFPTILCEGYTCMQLVVTLENCFKCIVCNKCCILSNVNSTIGDSKITLCTVSHPQCSME